MSRRPSAPALVLVCCALAAPRAARAQDREATATALFDEGHALMVQRRYAEACPKLAESQRLAPSGGTLINLAECYERSGRTASAWAAWKDAAARANAAGKPGPEKSALARAAALEPALARLTIALAPGSDVAGLEVTRDGVPVGAGELGSAMPVDPGTHHVEAQAPGKKPWAATVDVAAKQRDARVTVSLEDAPQAPAVAAATAADAPPPARPAALEAVAPPAGTESEAWPAQRTVAIGVGAAGVVGVAVGSAFGLIAKSKNDQALEPANCRTSTQCSTSGLTLTDDARSAATVSTVAFIAGGAAIATGAVLWFTAPHGGSGAAVRARPVLAGSRGGLGVDGAG
jgi:hypothetical protein